MKLLVVVVGLALVGCHDHPAGPIDHLDEVRAHIVLGQPWASEVAKLETALGPGHDLDDRSRSWDVVDGDECASLVVISGEQHGTTMLVGASTPERLHKGDRQYVFCAEAAAAPTKDAR